ncbi:NAD(P)H-dependent oxidoreductase [Geomesophilobacter sediminis]|uniref:NAD(P)H-dependent oxidoreductase n=1 Tax=Geomesophilobacter sediminis TaxID=2798584 RepID=A0A8J7M0J2_9BACT|nr:NAD(P)H-dependent oxidoreductase [Geomesophilobacter sediminis]MBJ6725472.1 NAD(P)H-dependent oxidoreductase [Geomesophilobacter sediminis]
MANVLYVTCNLSPQGRSRTLSLGYQFLEEYLRWNPRDEVRILDLYRDNIQRFDQDVYSALKKIVRGEGCSILTDDERRKMSRIWQLADQFGGCDKYIFVTHSLNLWLPAEFKVYVDTICVPNRTYRLTPYGAEGMLPGEWKKSLHLHAAPFSYGKEADQSIGYLRSLLNFFGVTDQESVLLEGDDMDGGDDENYQAARRRLMDLALRF